MQKLLRIAATVFVSLCCVFTTLQGQAFEPTGDSFPANFEMTSWTSSATGSSLTAEGVVGEGYGKVYLSYDFTSSTADRNRGNFAGNLRSINQDGEMIAATLQGVWKRDGKSVMMYTLDAFSNGDMIYAEGIIDLIEGTLKFTAFPMD